MGAVDKYEYRTKFLKSEMWMQIRNRVMTHHGCKCFICGKVDAFNDVHHLKYPKNVWEGPHRHLVVLCRTCHDIVHEIKDWPDSSKDRWEKLRLMREEPRFKTQRYSNWKSPIKRPRLVKPAKHNRPPEFQGLTNSYH